MALERTDSPELWAFLESLQTGTILSGVVAQIERFGVFVDLDDGPPHPSFAGVGFITIPELSWQRVGAVTDIVQVGQRVTCEFIMFDTWNLEARLSLRALQPDPFQAFADRAGAGAGVRVVGQVTRVLPFGFFVRVAEGVEGLVRSEDVDVDVDVGDDVEVVIADIDRGRRKLELRVW